MTEHEPRRVGSGRLALAAVVILATALLAPASAGADSADVTVTAQVAPVFSLTILTDGLVPFGQVLTGETYTSPAEPVLRVTSSLPWNFSDSSDPTITIGGTTVPRSTVVRHEPTPAFGEGLPAGVREIDCTYTLDMTSPTAMGLTPGTLISTRLGYTVVQQ